MSTEIPLTRYAILGTTILLAVLIAGCTSGPSVAPQTPTVTVSSTPVPTSPAPITMQMTTSPLPIPLVPTGNATVPQMTATTPLATVNQTSTPPPLVAIAIQHYSFNPKTVTVPVGTTVTWTNYDISAHLISSSVTPMFGPGKIFMSKTLETNDTYSFTFTTVGVYQYFCVFHPTMIGTITVK